MLGIGKSFEIPNTVISVHEAVDGTAPFYSFAGVLVVASFV